MSARSPRASFSGASSVEVAADFAESLKDLQGNNRYEISNLTIIAKENTEHAQAISQALQTHIKTAAPTKKLPALYVLDSIVKNVGTPYTVYLGRNLYGTFMEAYTQVDSATRRNMEAMLKTWKEPVPGAMDPRPVFPLESVKPIENALIKARTAALKHGQPPPRSTPTPPQLNDQYGLPPGQYGQQQAQYAFGGQQATPLQYPAMPPFQPPPSQQPPQYQFAPPQQQPSNELEIIKSDLSSLVARTRDDFANNLYDDGLRQRLKALLDLQQILNTQQLPPQALQAVKQQIMQLSAAATSTPQQSAPQPAISTPQWQPPLPAGQPYGTPQQGLPFMRPPSAQQYPQTQPQPSAPVLAPGQLDTLQALFANGQKPSTPQMRTAAPALQGASHGQLNNVQNQVAAAPQANTSDLLASLAKSGLFSTAPSIQQPPALALSTIPSLPLPPPSAVQASTTPVINSDILASLMKTLPQPGNNIATPPVAHSIPILSNSSRPRMQMTSTSLRSPLNPALVRSLYDDQPNQCSNCGRRFLATPDGRAKKQRHLDWHFRTNQRLADPAIARGSHRNWFVDEHEWVVMKEFDVSTATAADTAAAAAAAAATAGGAAGTPGFGSGANVSVGRGGAAAAGRRVEDRFVRAPPGLIVNKCSICQEDMKASHPPEQDDWVFVNAARWGGKIVHATCLNEMTGGAASGGAAAAASHSSGGNGGGSLAAALAAVGGGAGAAGQRERSATPDSLLGKRKAEAGLAGQGARLKRE